MNILSIDIGTSGMRGILYDRSAAALKMIYIPYSPVYYSDIRVEQNTSDWSEALLNICGGMAGSGLPIDAVSLTSQRSSVIPLSDRMEPLCAAIMWQDKRCHPLCRRLEPFRQVFIAKAGSPPNPVYTAGKIAWLQENRPEICAQTAKFAVIPDYLKFLMTGTLTSDHTYGSRTSLMNIETRDWDEELLSIWGIERRKLCDLCPPGSAAGTISKTFSNMTGLTAGIPVISAGGDQQCCALGQGIFQEGDVLINAGSGAYIITVSDHLPAAGRQNVVLNAGAAPGTYLIETNVLTCCSAFDWFHRNFYPENDFDFQIIDSEIDMSPPLAGGVIALPLFQGRGTPDWNTGAAATFHNITLSSSRGDLARALLEGICFETKVNYDALSSYFPSVSAVTLSGGLSKCSVLPDTMASVLNVPVRLYGDSESTALGSWISASVALGVYPDYASAFSAARKNETAKTCLPVNSKLYEAGYQTYRHIYASLYQEA